MVTEIREKIINEMTPYIEKNITFKKKISYQNNTAKMKHIYY